MSVRPFLLKKRPAPSQQSQTRKVNTPSSQASQGIPNYRYQQMNKIAVATMMQKMELLQLALGECKNTLPFMATPAECFQHQDQ